MDRLRCYLRLSAKPSTCSSTSQPEAKADAGDEEKGDPGKRRKCKPTATHRHSQQKRPSESSALTTVSSIRSSTQQPSHITSGAQVDESQVKGQRRASKGSATTDSPSTHCHSAKGPPEDRHFPFPPPPVEFLGNINRGTGAIVRREGVGDADDLSLQSSSNLERDLEVIDLLERERSLDIQQGLERERQELGKRPVAGGGGGRRQLPSVVRQGQKRRNLVTDSDPFDGLLTSGEQL